MQLDFKGAIFDLDGTLLDSMSVWEQIDIEFLEMRKLVLPDGYTDAVKTMGFTQAAEYTIKTFSLKETVADLISQWHEMAIDKYATSIELKPHAYEYLHRLKSQGIKLGVATSSTKELFEPVLKRNYIYDLFSVIITAKDVNRGKEHPDIYLLASEMLGVKPSDCAVFEDILPGIAAAKSAGMKVVGVYDSYSIKEQPHIMALADRYIYDFSELL